MSKNINHKQKIIGYIDDYGFLYCPTHASAGMDGVKSGEENGSCKICGTIIEEDENDLQ